METAVTETPRLADAGQAPGLVFRGRYAVVDRPDGGMSIPRAFAVLRLIINSKVRGW